MGRGVGNGVGWGGRGGGLGRGSEEGVIEERAVLGEGEWRG